MSLKIPRRQYADLYGPTTGDRVRLADTDLFIEIEKDLTTPGDEAKFGGGKSLRDGMGQSSTAVLADGALDLVITNAIVLDHTGIFKADIGIRGNRIAGIGKAGNPDVMSGVTPGMIVGAGTEVIAGEGRIVTAGRHRFARPFHLPATHHHRPFGRAHHADWRRHGSCHRYRRHHLHSGCLEHAPHARIRRRVSHKFRLSRQG